MAAGRFVKLLALLPALTAKCDDSLATRNQLTVIMRRADMQVLHVYSPHYPLLPPDSVMSSYIITTTITPITPITTITTITTTTTTTIEPYGGEGPDLH